MTGRRLCSLAVLVFWAGSSSAQQASNDAEARDRPRAGRGTQDLNLYLGVGQSDNIGHFSQGIRSSFATAGLQFDFERLANRADITVNSDLQYRTYGADEFESEPVGNFDATIVMKAVPSRFSWVFEEHYGQTRTNTFQAIGPLNRESVNVVSTGPVVTLPFGGRTRLVFSGLLSDRRFNDTINLDSESAAYRLSVVRNVARTTAVSLSVTSNEIEFDSLVPTYTISTAVVGYSKLLASGDVNFSVGQNELEFLGVESDGPTFRFDWNRSLGVRSEFAVSAARELTDAGNFFSSPGQIGFNRMNNVSLSSSPFELQSFGFDYQWNYHRSTVGFGMTAFREQYEADLLLSNESLQATFSFRKDVTQRLEAGFDLGRLRREFDFGQEDEDDFVELFLSRRLSESTQLSFRIQRNQRTGLDAFDETLYEVRIAFAPQLD